MAFPKNSVNRASLGHTRAIIVSPLLNLSVKWEAGLQAMLALSTSFMFPIGLI